MNPSGPPLPAPPTARSFALAALGLGLCVLGVRWALLARFGSDVPYWDEWPADALELFRPWKLHQLSWPIFLTSHNGHRIALTRLWELAFFVANGERWDPLLVQTANAIVVAAVAALLAVMLVSAAAPRHRLAVFAASLVLLTVPFGYSNLLIAFQSQFAFFAGCSVVALACWCSPSPSPRRLAIGFVAAVVALFTVGSGVLVPLSLTLIAGGRAWRERSRQWFICAISAGLIAILGLVASDPTDPTTMAAVVAGAARYFAWPAGNFVSVLAMWPASARYLPSFAATWPSPHSAWLPVCGVFLSMHPGYVTALCGLLGLIMHAPAIVLLARTLRRLHPPWPLLGVIGWAWLNLAAMAVARSGVELVPPRYQDILAIGLLANAAAWWALRHDPTDSSPRRFPRLLSFGWLMLMAGCVAVTAVGIFRVELPRKRAENRAAAALLQQYLAHPDIALFRNRPPNHVPWPGQERDLAYLLRDRTVRGFLPSGVLPAAERPAAPLPSRIAGTARTSGPWIILTGLALIAVAFFRPAGHFGSQVDSS